MISMASLSRRIRRNMARPAIRQIRRNRRALSQAVQPLARGMAGIGKSVNIVAKQGNATDG